MNTLLLNRDGFQMPAGEWEAWAREEWEKRRVGRLAGQMGSKGIQQGSGTFPIFR